MEPAPNTVLSYQSQRPVPRTGPLTLLLLCALGLLLLALIGSAVGDILYIQLWHKYLAGVPISAATVTLAQELQMISPIAMTIGLAVAFALLLWWTFVAHRRLAMLTMDRLRFSAWTVIFAWFLPRSCYIQPYEAMKFLYNRSQQRDARAFAPMVGTWWASWLIAWFLMLSATFAQRHRETGITDAQFSIDWNAWNLVPVPAFFVSGLLLMLIVYKIDRAQKREQIARKSAAIL